MKWTIALACLVALAACDGDAPARQMPVGNGGGHGDSSRAPDEKPSRFIDNGDGTLGILK